MIALDQEIRKEHTTNLQKDYKYVYICSKCSLKYGSDKKEKELYLCPLCEKK